MQQKNTWKVGLTDQLNYSGTVEEMDPSRPLAWISLMKIQL